MLKLVCCDLRLQEKINVDIEILDSSTKMKKTDFFDKEQHDQWIVHPTCGPKIANSVRLLIQSAPVVCLHKELFP